MNQVIQPRMKWLVVCAEDIQQFKKGQILGQYRTRSEAICHAGTDGALKVISKGQFQYESRRMCGE